MVHSALCSTYHPARIDRRLSQAQSIAGSEDKSMKIWSMAGSCLQTIAFSGCVWSVAFLPSGDAVAGVSDSKAYVFSSDEIRQGPDSMHAAFEAEVAAHAAENAPTQGTGAHRPFVCPS